MINWNNRPRYERVVEITGAEMQLEKDCACALREYHPHVVRMSESFHRHNCRSAERNPRERVKSSGEAFSVVCLFGRYLEVWRLAVEDTGLGMWVLRGVCILELRWFGSGEVGGMRMLWGRSMGSLAFIE